MNFSERLGSLAQWARYRRSPPHFVVVLGMHRSGTSCATRILNLMGASFGRTVVDQPALDNGEIHWESANAIWINNEILGNSGGSWKRPPVELKYGWRDRWRCNRFLWEYADVKVALVKDPRLVITYELWAQVLPKHTIVLCIRHPLNVARSLEKRDGIPLADGLELWRQYNAKLLDIAQTTSPVLGFDFDQGSIGAAQFIDTSARCLPLNPTEDAKNHYTADARHHSETDELSSDIEQLYSSLRQIVSSSNG